MAAPTTDALRYYSQPGIMTDPRTHAELFAALPRDIATLCEIVQGLLLHIHWAQAYGASLSEERKQEANIRPVDAMLGHMRALDDRPLTAARPVEKRLGGVCRHFSTLLCAMLRHQGVAARQRCGFGAYFTPGTYVDHWVCEYWNVDEARWVMVDAQLDAFQCNALQVTFDPCDVPPDQFIVAGKAWEWCRRKQADPQRFGIFDLRGMWFIRGNLLRDLANFNRVELLPWDGWGLMSQTDPDPSDPTLAVLDRIAALTQAGDAAFDELHALYETDGLRVPPVIDTYTPSGVERVTLDR